MKKIVLLLIVMTLLLMSCSSYRTATSKCITYNDTKAAKERADYPKLHKKNQFNPKSHYNENIWSKIFDGR
jgi:uncharacterized protein YceK